jgi:hypothetical protein
MRRNDHGYKERSFHFSIVPAAMLFLGVIVLLTVFSILSLTTGGRRTMAEAFAIGVPGLLFACIAFAAFLVTLAVYNKLVPTGVGSEGVATYNGLGVPVSVRWEHITGVRRITLWPGMTFLQLMSGKNLVSSAYVPTFLTEPNGFMEALLVYAGEDHPLTKEFKRLLSEQ